MTERAAATPRTVLEDGYDLNTLRRTGEYTVTNPQGAPIADSSFFVDVVSGPVQGVARTTQRAQDVATGIIYYRSKAGPWGEWITPDSGGGGGGGNYWEGATVALTAPDFIDPDAGYQFNLTGTADEAFNILDGVPGQRINLTQVGGTGAKVAMNPDTGAYALRDIFGNLINDFTIAGDGDSVLLEYRMPQDNNGGWYIVNANQFMTITVADPSNAGTRTPYDIPATYSGTPGDSEVIFSFYVVRSIFWESGFGSGSGGFASTPPATAQEFLITFDDTQIGTMTVYDGDGYCEFALDVDGDDFTTLLPGGVLKIVAPASADATMADFNFTLMGYLA